MILMNLQAAPKENAGARRAEELECEYGSAALCVRDGEDCAALVIKMIYDISWQGRRGGVMGLSQNAFPLSPECQTDRFVEEIGWLCLCVIVHAGYGHVSWFIVGPVPLLLGITWIWTEVSNLFILQLSMESQR
jgi:hypothetical protein